MAGDPERRFRAVDLITVNRSATIARLLAGVVHDANNALQVISGTTELLLGASDLPEPVVKGYSAFSRSRRVRQRRLRK
jgi:hypothetical protein